ncbi:MAG: Crp/Fnr family transcriptional regulator [Bacteroidaceae bacterium]|jgi:CRP-like cAMP-binding protein|nr:Crp/Fnr family transcriptional regulator [Bacteroidaceae bacterium]
MEWMKMDEFKKLLSQEAPYKLSDEMMEVFCSSMEVVKLKRYDMLIKSGAVDDNVYVVKKGIIRRGYPVGDKTITKSFATAGSVLVSWHSYFLGKPSFSFFEACCNSEVMCVTKERFDELIAMSHEFSQWALSIAHATLYLDEYKSSVLRGDIKERYVSLIKNRPEVMREVPLGYIASYLGITQQHLSRIRKELVAGK